MKTFLLTLLLVSTSVLANNSSYKEEIELGRQAVLEELTRGDYWLKVEVEVSEIFKDSETGKVREIWYSTYRETEGYACDFTYVWKPESNDVDELDGDCDAIEIKDEVLYEIEIEQGRNAVLEEVKKSNSKAKVEVEYTEAFTSARTGEVLEISFMAYIEGSDYECSFSYLWDAKSNDVQELDGDCDSL